MRVPGSFLKIGFAWARAQMGVGDYESPSVTDWASFLMNAIPADVLSAYAYNRALRAKRRKTMNRLRAEMRRLEVGMKLLNRLFEEDPSRAVSIFMQSLYTFKATAVEKKTSGQTELQKLLDGFLGDNSIRRKRGIAFGQKGMKGMQTVTFAPKESVAA